MKRTDVRSKGPTVTFDVDLGMKCLNNGSRYTHMMIIL